MAVALAMIPHVSNLLMLKWGSLLNALGRQVETTLPALTDEALLTALASQGAHVGGHQGLAGGSIVVGLIWGSLAAFLIDGRYGKAALVAVAGALLTFVGMIHSASLGLNTADVHWGYVIVAAVVGALALLTLGKKPEEPTGE